MGHTTCYNRFAGAEGEGDEADADGDDAAVADEAA
jgi:hypothetical protein